ncbi:ML domain-containing protein [Diplogelasinospora grovesii]|uniref:Phosphatidylglycerol/phosphatidylinositol transfer protein n=1 Tax=Diplogelasinospora grovesii TaxID=303347 RepID=A0AAN6NFJ0_9PEZI|nr:ML domain-containing protein [Diplogelasinospora grovesii]
MRFSAAIIAFLAASVNARSIFSGEDKSVIIDDELDVPGQSPLRFCNPDRDNDLIVIKEVVLDPNPPEAGKTLVIKASGTVKERIEEGAYVKLEVKYGYIKLISTTADLCKEIQNVALECPIEAGDLAVEKSVDLPREIPPGKYTVNADVYTKDDEHITCLTATVVFGRRSSSSGFFDIDL